jgi:hypothetical protein
MRTPGLRLFALLFASLAPTVQADDNSYILLRHAAISRSLVAFELPVTYGR